LEIKEVDVATEHLYNILQRFHPFKVGFALKSEKRCVFHPSNAQKRRQREKTLMFEKAKVLSM